MYPAHLIAVPVSFGAGDREGVALAAGRAIEVGAGGCSDVARLRSRAGDRGVTFDGGVVMDEEEDAGE